MTKTIVNLALSVVIREIEDVIDTYPYHPYQQAFSIPEMRQRLIFHVLSRIPSHYVVVDDAETSAIDTTCLYTCAGEKLQISSLIHHGVEHLLQEDSDWNDRQISHETNPEYVASSWFG